MYIPHNLIKKSFFIFLHFRYIPNQKLHFVHEENHFSYVLHFITTLWWAEHGNGREQILSSRWGSQSCHQRQSNAASPRALKHIMQIVFKHTWVVHVKDIKYAWIALWHVWDLRLVWELSMEELAWLVPLSPRESEKNGHQERHLGA